jgi:deoxyadenosine/deoxycytidine kinase
MWILFEGLDKVGKTTLQWELLKATNFKYVVIDRGPIGYMSYDKILNRETDEGNKRFINMSKSIMEEKENFIVVFCYADKNVVDSRLKAHKEKQLKSEYTYKEMHDIIINNIRKFYKAEKTIEINTGENSIEDCVKLIVNKIKEVENNEL